MLNCARRRAGDRCSVTQRLPQLSAVKLVHGQVRGRGRVELDQPHGVGQDGAEASAASCT